ncbi:hypothetical protein BDV95DRAFT_268680 [Massariosphaeria phaeospora]|uniref:F-box domain-containing protein n=1 Tax=Massariosphaeria phaeospora TaxID=100035 RepID=A0A7C8I4L8_9PLEO|nr:hypothetical protein BDV95DRAFT_268680 [Massariosphaeria phaeospora]
MLSTMPSKRKYSEAASEDESSKRVRSDEPFRFLDLPAEVQNRIYELITGDPENIKLSQTGLESKGSILITHPQGLSPPASVPRSGLLNVAQIRIVDETVILARPTKPRDGPVTVPPIPLLNMIQTCTKIRNELRQWWMGYHVIAFRNIDKYVHCFLLQPDKPATQGSNEHTKFPDILRLSVSSSHFDNSADILNLVKLKNKHNIKVVFLGRSDPWVDKLADVISNNHPNWLGLLDKVSHIQVEHLMSLSDLCHVLHIQLKMKAEYEEDWMRALNPTSHQKLKHMNAAQRLQYGSYFGFVGDHHGYRLTLELT